MAVSEAANAECIRAQVCDDFGMNCHAEDICDSTTDIPSVDVDPITPIPSAELKPLPSVDIPPVGTSGCKYMQVNGRWENICQ